MNATEAHDALMVATRNMELAAIQLAETISVQQYVDTDPTYMAQRGPVADAKRADAQVRYLANYRAACADADNARRALRRTQAGY
jgi:hypothetical protein